jgi:hypothetical protein
MSNQVAFLGSALPLYTAMSVRIRKKTKQPHMVPGWRQVAIHDFIKSKF